MPKKTLKSMMPTPERLREIKSLHILGDWIYANNLWHINRYSSAMGFFVGLFMAFMPIPGQMVLAAAMAVLLRCNLPLSVGLVWITNPVTMPAIYYLAYRLGALILRHPVQAMEFELSFHWLTHRLSEIWEPFLLGCLLLGLFFGSLGYFMINILWRIRVATKWRQRKRDRARRAGPQ
ncbi:DUF2062 domain-containing protein [Mangrovimicrobium sediminis]|uniref:DUF2062 domain-containing protein n=1 Tax=Mangrovimicrobium sediminis TaxID=2562682 RepID=A0A4Z0M2A2_9GAMM|nr:DUF2062 domain-containing protein [Haliea sp. SAOS-164]TGD73600.1 DUF2062 domain-containing protein [Haliea sp. SAOS-164]